MAKVVITLPAYHAERTLARTLGDIPAGVADEIIVVDDASTDGTVDRARELGTRLYVHPKNRGYGGNQKTCYLRALEHGADIVVLLHPDYQYDPKAVPLLIAPILAGQADMTFGSRFAGLGDPRGGGMPLYRFVGNRVTTGVENLLLGSRFTEMHSGLRAYTRGCLLDLPFLRYADDFTFDSQMLVDAVTSGKRVVEVPIPTRYTAESSSISIARSVRYVGASVAYCAAASARRGRRGRRWPVTFGGTRSRSRPANGTAAEGRCILCGSGDLELLYAANAGDAAVDVREYSCTSGVLSKHDDIIRCRRCGMVSSKPTTDATERAAHYEKVVDETYLDEEAGRRKLFEWVLERMDGYAVSGKRLLEIGSNVGVFLDVARSDGWEARGVEPSLWAVQEGTRRFGVDVSQGTIETLGNDEPVDAIVMLDVFEHLTDPVAALRQVRPRLQDEGLLVLSTVNIASIHARMRRGAWPWLIRPHLHYFTPETLDAMLARTGYTLVEWTVVPRTFHLSYIAGRVRESLGTVGDALVRASRVVDPQLPVGWLGDVVLAVARPSRQPLARAGDDPATLGHPYGATND